MVDANGQPLGYFYGRDDDTDRKVYPLSRDEARRMTVNFARLPELLALEKSERIFDGDHVRTHLSLPHVLRVLHLHPTQTPAGRGVRQHRHDKHCGLHRKRFTDGELRWPAVP